MSPLVSVLFLGVFVALFGAALVMVSSLLGPRSIQSAMKKRPYECGLEGDIREDTKIPVKYYLTAILFILFDIEIIFMYPWAVAYGDFISSGHGIYIFIAMAIFLAIFIFGLAWEIRSKALEWE
ncbi:MAG: NADH-quinone oxidoreductase subunit A [Bdellovibrionales bacterium]|nr:NADH-quinone oxidoreductase subunit A [Bdellovibrionales bacterium]